ncbi:sigma-54-dependent transcriptional regulator [Myroides indicus]|uniref:DNA-binding NtrC family response regulator n=1 Tax=Myroides indicus TaxID=1323422 RepID=A0A4R7EYU6_9FLAO|nr:sigma-54 dependent transcriptional regulator [Myroides indicus]TDS54621.1 DNA-binding NtrC family response regulator [Myroides indicus]
MKKTSAQILILDDNPEILIAAKMLLKRQFETVLTNTNPQKIISILSENNIDVILLDMNYRTGYEDGKEGIFWFKEIKKINPDIQIILMTSYGNIETAVEGIKLGAIDYILKPWNNEILVQTVKEAVKQIRKKTRSPLKYKQAKDQIFTGQSANIQKTYKMAERVAKTDVNTLILGENGTGKYILAKYIHLHSERKDYPFVHVDLGALNENLFESELFGYATGAFTDAKKDTKGRFELAEGGTLFLDEIGNVPLYLQTKLLQVIQSRNVIRLGESKPRPVNIRIITATNLNIEKEVANKLFREDLFYRINTVILNLPPLRERKEDIVPLISFFLEHYAQKYNRPTPNIAVEALKTLEQYDWKGNIRELQNRVERALILSEENTLKLSDFGITGSMIYPVDEESTLLEKEKNSILRSLEKYNGNISQTAEELGLSRAALYRRLEKFNLKNRL